MTTSKKKSANKVRWFANILRWLNFTFFQKYALKKKTANESQPRQRREKPRGTRILLAKMTHLGKKKTDFEEKKQTKQSI